MKLSEISANIQYLFDEFVDKETGELSEQVFDQLEAMQIEESEKIESLALLSEQLKAESEIIKEKTKSMIERAKQKESKADRIKAYLSNYLLSQNRMKFETPYVLLSFRKSTKTEIVNEQSVYDFAKSHAILNLIKVKEEISKTAIANAIKSGVEIPGAILIESQNIQIK